MTKLTFDEFKAKFMGNDYYVSEYDTKRELNNALRRDYKEYVETYNRPLVKKIVFNLPHTLDKNGKDVVSGGEADILYVNGKRQRITGLNESGTGYIKDLYIMDDILNKYARQNLFDYEEEASFTPYTTYERLSMKGVTKYDEDENLYYTVEDVGDYFNYNIRLTGDSNSVKQYIITFKNGATGRMYAHKVVAPPRKRAAPKKHAPTVRVNVRRMF